MKLHKNFIKIISALILMSIFLSSCSELNENPYSDSYSKHGYENEKEYRTVLADPSKLSEGVPVLALKEKIPNWRTVKFAGFIKGEVFGYDVRYVDISKYDLNVVEDYNDLSFSSVTGWPKNLPDGFDPESILEFNKNPGLGIRELHEQGITGSGIGIAIIDQALLTDHEEYKDNLMYYELIHYMGSGASMHGPAVASIAAGKTVGVAPGAKLYHIADIFGHTTESGNFNLNFSILADCILRIVEINTYLPQDEKIRVISISRECMPGDPGYSQVIDAIEKAESENIFVLTVSPEIYYEDFDIGGMNRAYDSDPDDFNSYTLPDWYANSFYNHPESFENSILFPMGSRAYASCTGTQNYEISYQGGMSWVVPWCAGFYALCCQVKPDITPEEFIKLVQDTSIPAETVHEGTVYIFGKIINPAEVIKALQESE